ncbi:FxsC protein [Streptacidiphilus sp. N1-12]|uniref:FxsC protein n=2 Tax=Streptacidiphilus alkalitolerans TaxID=3342712 RepID=A0ABV6X4Y5_9ACTN
MTELAGERGYPSYFLSYSYPRGAPQADPWVAEFHADLNAALGERPAKSGGLTAGYLDEPGESEPVRRARRAEALARSKSLVVLCSPEYFLDAECHNEWTAFHKRLSPEGSSDAAVVAVLWERLWAGTPDEVSIDEQDLRLQFGENGLRHQLAQRRAQYHDGVRSVAEAIAHAVEKIDLAPGAESALSREPQPWPDHPAVRSLRILVLARTTDEALPPGCDPEDYSELPELWQPYREEGARPLAELAATVARDSNVHVRSVEDFERASRRVAGTSQDAELVPQLLLLDRWALRNDLRLRSLLGYNRQRLRPMAVMVPWVPRPEGIPRREQQDIEQLRLLTWDTLNVALGQPTPGYEHLRGGIPDAATFAALLPIALRQARNAFIQLHALRTPQSKGQQ